MLFQTDNLTVKDVINMIAEEADEAEEDEEEDEANGRGPTKVVIKHGGYFFFYILHHFSFYAMAVCSHLPWKCYCLHLAWYSVYSCFPVIMAVDCKVAGQANFLATTRMFPEVSINVGNIKNVIYVVNTTGNDPSGSSGQ